MQCKPAIADILIAEMAEIGYESFLETEGGFLGSVVMKKLNKELLEDLFRRYENESLVWKVEEVEKENWNKKWEENYSPVEIGGLIRIRASFHRSDPSYKYELIITPRMSFGTGHHETTELMLMYQLYIDFRNKEVLDAGCGTGILSIMASKLGASKITCFDMEDWAIENAKENFEVNGTSASIIHGSAEDLPEQYYDVIMANINKKVLLDQMKYYASHLRSGGILMLSGFYVEDVKDILEAGEQRRLKKIGENAKNNWALLILSK